MLSTSEFQPTDKLEGDTTTCQRPALIADNVLAPHMGQPKTWATLVSDFRATYRPLASTLQLLKNNDFERFFKVYLIKYIYTYLYFFLNLFYKDNFTF